MRPTDVLKFLPVEAAAALFVVLNMSTSSKVETSAWVNCKAAEIDPHTNIVKVRKTRDLLVASLSRSTSSYFLPYKNLLCFNSIKAALIGSARPPSTTTVDVDDKVAGVVG